MRMRYSDYVSTVVKELEDVLTAVKEDEVAQLVKAILEAKRIQVFGVGRMGFCGRAFAMRLMHLGLKAYVVWEAVTPSIGKGDLLIVNCGCTRFGRDVADLAKRAGATVALITAHPESEIGKLADVVLKLPAQLHEGGEGEHPSIQPMATLFEQSLFVLSDLIVLLLMERLKMSPAKMAERHTNLDGYTE